MNIEILVQAGAVGIALALCWLIDRRDKRNIEMQKRKDHQLTSIVTNHINHSNKVMEDLTNVIYELKTTLIKVNGKDKK